MTRLLVILHESPPLRPDRPRRSGATSASAEWHDRPRPGGRRRPRPGDATLTSSWRRDLDPGRRARALPHPGGDDLDLVPAVMTSTTARRCDLDPVRCPRPRRSLRSRTLASRSLDGALHRRLATYLGSTAAYGPGLAKGSTAREGVDGTGSTTTSRQRWQRQGGRI
jgi:hypothetical protein